MFFIILLFSAIYSSFADIIGIPSKPIFDGDTLVLVCERGRYFKSVYYWYKNGKQWGSNEYNRYRDCASSKHKYCYSKNQLYIKKVEFEFDNEVIWRCKVDKTNHWYITSVGTARVSKTILTTSSVLSGDSILTRPGDKVTVECATEKVLPQPRIWLCMTKQHTHTCSQGLVGSSSNQWSISKTENAISLPSVSSVYCAATNSDVLVMSQEVVIKQYDAPKLSISLSQNNGSVFIYCTVKNKSPNTTFFLWTHHVGNEHIRDINSTLKNEYTSFIEILTNFSSDAGTYICSASNGIKDKTTKEYYQFAAYTVNFNGIEFHDDENVENKSANFGENTELYSLFSSDHYDVSWFHNNSQITLTNHTSFSVEYSSIPSHYNASIKIPAKRSVLKIKRIDLTDEGIYYCSICSLKTCVNSSVKYMFVNKRVVSTTDTLIEREVSSVAIGGIVFLVLLLLAVTTLLVIVLYRWKTTYRDVSQRKTIQEPVLEILENNMYISGDVNPTNPDNEMKQKPVLEILENKFYVSEDENSASPGIKYVNSSFKSNGNGAVYAQVNKPNKKQSENKSNSDIAKENVYYNTSRDSVYSNVHGY